MVKKKEEKRQQWELQPTQFADKWGVYKFLTDVQSDLKTEITSDFVLAKLSVEQKEAIIELVRDAYFIKKEMLKYCVSKRYKIDKKGKWIKNRDGSFKKEELNKEEKEYIKNMAQITFNAFMIKILMTNIEYRNVQDNTLVELITEKEKLDEESEKLKKENEKIMETMARNIKKSGKED